jgi:ATP-grasp domain
MMEEYMDGPEVDVDVVMSEGQAVYGAVTDNWPTQEPYFNETGSNAPSILPSLQQRELLDLSVKSVQALGFAAGVFHVECKYTSRGARLIEVNCRMGGGPVRTTNLMVWGVDLVEEALLACAGIPSRPNVAPKPLVCLGEYFVNAPRTGTLRDTGFLAAMQEQEDVLVARPLLPEGSRVVSLKDGLPTWVVELVVKSDSVQTAIKRAEELEREICGKLVIN